MPKNKKIKKVLVVGSDTKNEKSFFPFSCIEVCRELENEEVDYIYLDSNPATIFKNNSSKEYIIEEKINKKFLEKLILSEKIDMVFSSFSSTNIKNILLEMTDFLEDNKVVLFGSDSSNSLKEVLEEIEEPFIEKNLIEKYISDWKLLEYEIMRDKLGRVVVISNLEGMDSVGKHLDDNIFVLPSQTLSDREYQMLRKASAKIADKMGVVGPCSIRFALNSKNFEYAVIDVNTNISQNMVFSSNLVRYPLEKVTTGIAMGYTLDEIMIENSTCAFFEPSPDIVGIILKNAVGFSTNIESALMKIVRTTDESVGYLYNKKYANLEKNEILINLEKNDDDRLYVVAEAIRKEISLDKICEKTRIDKYFVGIIYKLVKMEIELGYSKLTPQNLNKAKKMGFTDKSISWITGKNLKEIIAIKEKNKIDACYKSLDRNYIENSGKNKCFFTCYDTECESKISDKKKIIIIGPGYSNINENLELEIAVAQCASAIRKNGFNAIIINDNFDSFLIDSKCADKLYYESFDLEYVMNIISKENPNGVILEFGGKKAMKFAKMISEKNIEILGISLENYEKIKNKKELDIALVKCGILKPMGNIAYSIKEAVSIAEDLNYPVFLRQLHDINGKKHASKIARDEKEVVEYISEINSISQDHPIFVDKYIDGKEIEIDVLYDGNNVLIPEIIEHTENDVKYSSDSIGEVHQKMIIDYTKIISKELELVGIFNMHFIISNGLIYIVDINPGCSKNIPRVSERTKLPIVKIASNILVGNDISSLGFKYGIYKNVTKKLQSVTKK